MIAQAITIAEWGNSKFRLIPIDQVTLDLINRSETLNRLLKYPLRNRKATQGDFDFSDFLFAL